MDARTRITKEVLCEESRFILANILAETRYSRQDHYEDIRKVCEPAISLPFGEYVNFLEVSGYLEVDRVNDRLSVSPIGEQVVNGANLQELTHAAVVHFKALKNKIKRKDGSPLGDTFSSPPLPPPGGASRPEDLSRFEKLLELGSGGIGTVYRAKQLSLGRDVALKEVRDVFTYFPRDQHPELIKRFGEVIKQTAILSHPNINPIHDVVTNSPYPFVVSELAPNGSARRLIADAESVPLSLVLRCVLQTLHGLSAAHRQGIFHRGIRPENLLLDAFGNVRLSDFGFSKIVARDAAVVRQVYVGMNAVAYLAPEIFTDPANADAQADIYALGIVFYELVARKLPGRRSPLLSEIDARLPKGVDDIFDLMTRDDRQERYTKVEDILEDFDKVQGMTEVLEEPTRIPPPESMLTKVKFRAVAEDAECMGDADEHATRRDGSIADADVVSSAQAAVSGEISSPPLKRTFSFRK